MQPEKSGLPACPVPPPFAWREGRLLEPVAAAEPAAANARSFSLQAIPGELLPRGSGPIEWSFHLGAEASWELRSECAANGFRIHSPDGADEAIIICRPGGVLCGLCRGRLAPAFFSASAGTEIDDDAAFLVHAGGTLACLVTFLQPDGSRRFGLASHADTREDLETRARLESRQDAAAVWQRLWRPRENARALLAEVHGNWEADVELLCRSVQPAGPATPARWMKDPGDAESLLRLDATLPAVLAWRHLDREVAGDLMTSALACGHDEGWVPAATRPDNPGGDRHRAFPCLALAADLLDPGEPEWDLWQRPLQRNLEWWIAHWPERSAATDLHSSFDLDPAAPHLRRGALAALLAAECAAFLNIARRDGGSAERWITLHRACNDWRLEAMARMAEGQSWSPDELACWHLGTSYADANAGLPGIARNPGGETSPLTAAFQLICDERAHATGTQVVTPLPHASGIAPAALRVAAAARAARATAQGRSPLPVARWLDRHGRWAALAACVLLLAFIALIIRLTLVRTTLTSSAVETTLGLAARLHAEGKFAEALETYGRVQRGGHHLVKVDAQMGNACFRLARFTEAERHYREAMRHDPEAPMPALNLALALYRQGRREDAARQYEEFGARFGEAFPALARRAELARTILAEIQLPAADSNADASP